MQEFEQLRSEYSAEVQNFYPVETEAEELVIPEEGDAEEVSDAEVAEIEPPPAESDGVTVLVDVLVSTTARETLDGITIDLSHGDSQGNEKERASAQAGSSSRPSTVIGPVVGRIS